MKMKRKQYTCRCPAYDFPHRFGGGKCTGISEVQKCWENKIYCRQCIAFSDYGCDVINGQEHPRECPYVQDIENQYEIRL